MNGDVYLAIDGGQTGTTALLIRQDGALLGVGQGGPIRHAEESDAEERIREALISASSRALRGLPPGERISTCAVALTGSHSIAQRILPEVVSADRYHIIESDIFAALASGTDGYGGVGLVAGTGTVAIAQSATGEHVVRGGWGWFLGDEGGGFWIATQGLKAAARAADRTADTTVLEHLLPPLLGESDMRGVYHAVTGSRLDRARIASLAPAVLQAASSGDGVSQGIVSKAASRLADLVVSTITAGPILTTNEQTIVLCGGILTSGSNVLKELLGLLALRLPDFTPRTPAGPPVTGVYYLAMRDSGHVVSEEAKRRLLKGLQSVSTLKESK